MRYSFVTFLFFLATALSGCSRSESRIDLALKDLVAPSASPAERFTSEKTAKELLAELKPGDEQAYPILVRHIEIGHVLAAPLAIAALARIAPPEYAVPVLIKALGAEDGEVARAAAINLGSIGAQASSSLDKLLQARRECYEKEKLVLAGYIESAIASIDPKRAVGRMYKGLISKEWHSIAEWLDELEKDWPTGEKYFRAGDGVSIIRDSGTDDERRRAVSFLGLKVMKNPKSAMRLFAAALLIDFGRFAESALPALEYARDYDSNVDVRKQAGESIGAIKYAIGHSTD